MRALQSFIDRRKAIQNDPNIVQAMKDQMIDKLNIQLDDSECSFEGSDH